jgi:hypothetical protein
VLVTGDYLVAEVAHHSIEPRWSSVEGSLPFSSHTYQITGCKHADSDKHQTEDDSLDAQALSCGIVW